MPEHQQFPRLPGMQISLGRASWLLELTCSLSKSMPGLGKIELLINRQAWFENL
jgi:hypothetical protein